MPTFCALAMYKETNRAIDKKYFFILKYLKEIDFKK
jgi:hypothetical protein